MKEKEVQKKSDENKNENKFGRREIIKAFATLPVMGVFAYQYFKKLSYDLRKRNTIYQELGLSQESPTVITSSSSKGELIKLGIVGFGARGEQLARALGFGHPTWVENSRKNGTINEWLEQENLNVAITGICDVFDLNAERGMETASNDIRPGGGAKLPAAKRYRNYREMATSNDIDAIIISTPDFHHAPISIEAVKQGKHVYCEKCMTNTEEEVYDVEKAVIEAEKSKGIVFQVGHQYKQNTIYSKAKEIIEKNVLGKITTAEAFTNRNSPSGAWVRHLDKNGNPKPGNLQTIDWDEWLGHTPKVPFSLDRFYNWTKYWAYCTGLSGQLLSHEYDSLNQLLDLGIPKSCVASGGTYFYKDGREFPDIFNVVYEFPDKDLSVTYNGSLSSGRPRPRVITGNDAYMEIGGSLTVYPDGESIRYKENLDAGLLDESRPLLTYNPGAGQIDAITSASQRYYATRGLVYTYQGKKRIDVVHLHLKEWLDVIRNGGNLSCPIEKGFEVTIACHMATKSYRENRRVEWDPIKRRIV